MNLRSKLILLGCIMAGSCGNAQLLDSKGTFTRADTLRGTVTPDRAWWDVQRYDIEVEPEFTSKTISGVCRMEVKLKSAGTQMRVDLQAPMKLTDVYLTYILQDGKPGNEDPQKIRFVPQNKDLPGNTYLISLPKKYVKAGNELTIEMHFEGKPKEAVRPPWSGGWIWKLDERGRPWMSVACQGLGASVWFPCKDHQSDEPDKGATLTMFVPDTLVAVANGRPAGVRRTAIPAGKKAFAWEVKNPINSYNIIPYIGKYVHFSDTLMGEKGKLDLNYWVLDYNLGKARSQFEQVKPMLRCFEHWFGPYPFYEDGYKLVDAPHLGMEHQSAVAYGNQYRNGYRGTDLSNSGWGLKWDFIIVHESGHEWFGNNITSKDIADMWVHEGFTNYSETLYTEWLFGKQAGSEYVEGIRAKIKNDKPIIGAYGVNNEGSGDMYYKAANMIHLIRQVIDNDEKFRQMLRGLNKTFYHQTVTTQQVEAFINNFTGRNLSPVFNQYLRTVQIPVLEYKLVKSQLQVRFTNCVAGFNVPVKLPVGAGKYKMTVVRDKQWSSVATALSAAELEPALDRNYYVAYVAAQ